MISLLRVRVLFSLCACVFSLFSLSGFLALSLTHSGSHYASPIVHSLAPSDPRSLVPLHEAPEVGCRSRRRAAALRTRGPHARGGAPGLAPLPPATRIMALHVSYLPPYAPCAMAASGLCLPHTETARGGAEDPWVGPPEPQQLRLPTGGCRGPPVRGTSPRHSPSTCRDPVTPPLSPPCPPPRLGRRGPRVRYEPAPPLDALYGQCGPPGERRGPALPRAFPPTTAGAKGQPAPGGLLCRGGKATGRFVPASNGGLYPRHRAQTPVGR